MFLYEFFQRREIRDITPKGNSMTSITSTRADDPTPASVLQNLAASLATVISALVTAETDQRAAQTVLGETAPAGFDHAAGGRALAEASVRDLLNSGSTADGVQQRLEHERSAAEAAAATFTKRQVGAQAQAMRAGPMIVALRAQAIELDRAVRHELSRLGAKKEAEAEQVLEDRGAEYLLAFVEYRAAVWLQQAEIVGDRGQQFATLPESDFSMSFPDGLRDVLLDNLPDVLALGGPSNLVQLDRYVLANVISERRRALMAEATSNVYPRAGEGLHRTAQAGDAS